MYPIPSQGSGVAYTIAPEPATAEERKYPAIGRFNVDRGAAFATSDTISYGQLAELVERVTGREFEKTEWTLL
ncbi:hypothetical protein [Mesorhizobium sp. RMAD-H1]|uniref:hypothetical protein n=1 Tax=Mesorhizobium sp. RMAD-H1 TaxID=2587065 RepID=UPI0016143B3C|nr:hypothetical protein [Mesorhizobium sp. RMAD-H1]MBB2971445.1 hypothetical protein [Mesorhizobium sp. RMAD-H1]